MSSQTKLFSPSLESIVSSLDRKNLSREIEEEMKSSKLMKMLAMEEINPLEAAKQFALEMNEHREAMSVATEFRLIRHLHVMFLKVYNYFAKGLIDVAVTEKLEEARNLITLNYRVFKAKMSTSNYSDFVDTLVVVPNGYSANNYKPLLDDLNSLIVSMSETVDSSLSKLSNLLNIYISAFDSDRVPSATYDYAKELRNAETLNKTFENRSQVNFSASPSKNTDKVSNVILSFGQMEEVVESCFDLIKSMQKINLKDFNSKVNNVHNSVGYMMEKMEEMSDETYVSCYKNVEKLSAVLFAIAKQVELFSAVYYRCLTAIGALDNSMESLSKRM